MIFIEANFKFWLLRGLVFFGLIAGILGKTGQAAEPPQFEIFTAVLPPYTETIPESGPLTGFLAQIVQESLSAAGLKLVAQPKNLAWKRSQEIGRETPNSLIFPFARTPLREPNYKWVSIVVNDAFYAYSLKGAPAVKSLEDIKSLKRVGVTAGSAAESYAKSLGIESSLDPAPTDIQNYQKLSLARLDVVLGQIITGAYLTAQLGITDQVQRSSKLQELPLWVATSPQTSEEAIAVVRNALEAYKKTPRYAELTKQYQ